MQTWICACPRICSWSTWYPEIPPNLLNTNTTKLQVEYEPVQTKHNYVGGRYDHQSSNLLTIIIIQVHYRQAKKKKKPVPIYINSILHSN